MTTPMALRALYGPLPFYLVFLAIEAFKVIINVKTINVIWFIKVSKVISVFKIIFQVTFFQVTCSVFTAFANFSAALQLLFILDFRWTGDDLINGTSP